MPTLFPYTTLFRSYASSAVIRLRRSDFIEARYALSFVFANFGIAIAARMPMITTTIKSSISVKPFLVLITGLLNSVGDGESRPSSPQRRDGSLHRNHVLWQGRYQKSCPLQVMTS